MAGPSTYAPTITTILSRGYVEREAKALKPTALGEVVTQLMKDQFKKIVDVDFTAQMEKNLDEVEEGATDWVDTLSTFYEISPRHSARRKRIWMVPE